MKKLFIIGFLSTILSISYTSKAETWPLSLNGSEEFPDTSLKEPKFLGNATLSNGVKLPAYYVYFSSGIDMTEKERYQHYKPQTLHISKKLDTALANNFAVYYFAHEWFLIPKDWRFMSAGIGANASATIHFAPPIGKKGYFSAWTNNGGCYSCGLNMASYFFKEADRLNQIEYNASSQYLKTIPKVKMVKIRPYTQAWRATIQGQNIDGIAYFNPSEDNLVRVAEVSLPKGQEKLATSILNWQLW
ncbi:MAG: DUF4850 domain-containing protein [Acinetobacter sp.]|nr:DUF4850 domain-containing protein [Acinetobacter sp.]